MNTRTIIYVFGALVLGLLGGYFLFGGENLSPSSSPGERGDEADVGGLEAHDHGEAQIWTCSMHPQVQQNEPGDCPLCGMDLIPLQTGNSTDPAILTMTEAAVAMARVRTMIIGDTPTSPLSTGEGSGVRFSGAAAGAKKVEEAGLKLTGRLAPDARTAAVEVSEFGGRVERLFVSFAGEQVRAGQRIATVYSPDLVVAQEELLQANKFADLNPNLVAAARKKLLNLEVTEEQIAELEKTGEVTSNFPIYADRSGTIMDTKAEVGEYVKAGGALYTYTNLNNLWALFDAYEKDLAQIRVGDKVSFSVASRPGESYKAWVTFIDPAIDPKTRTAAVRAEVNNRGGRLKPEMFIEGEVKVERGKGRKGEPERGDIAGGAELIVPRSAVLWTGDRSVAYVELPDMAVPTYEFREITVSERVGDGYRITSGLAAGDRVVVNGAFQIDASAQLNNKASMMNRDVLVQGRNLAPSSSPLERGDVIVPDYKKDTPEAFRAQLGKVVEAYLPLKDRMVATEPADETLLAALKETLAKVEMTQVKGDAHLYWMQQMEAIEAHANTLLKKDDVKAQREQFGFLSQALIDALTAFGVDGTYYVQYCPMAFDNAGANWLSNEEQIRNPYFGDLMMKCGLVTDEL